MKSVFRNALVQLFILLATLGVSHGQQWINPNFDTQRLDYRDLGYLAQNMIEADNSRITALLAHSNGLVYGATSGRTQSYLFFFNKYINKVRPLGKIARAKGVYHSLLEGPDGSIILGTGLNMLAPVKLTKDFPVQHEGIEKQLWTDIKATYETFEGGHLYRYNPITGDVKQYVNSDSCPLEDLGIPVPHNSVYATTLNKEKTKVYGISYPDAHFFIFDLATKTVRDLGEILTHKVYGGPERWWRSVPRALYCDTTSGDVLVSGDNGYIHRYSVKTNKFKMTTMRLPGEYYEGYKSIDFPVVEAFECDSFGNLYAGTSDGYLIRLDLKTETTIVLGKPRMMRRMRAMKIGKDDRVYMITGELERVCKLHTYDLEGKKGFSELGTLAVDRSPYYAKRAYQFDAMAVGTDGSVFCGESDRDGKLFIYIPGPGAFKGMINPTNPVVERMIDGTPGLIPEEL